MARQTIRQTFRKTASIAGIVLLAGGLIAAAKTAMLYPDWSKPTSGTYDKPSGEIGKKTTEPWSTNRFGSISHIRSML